MFTVLWWNKREKRPKTLKNEKKYKETSRKEMEKKRKDENIRGNWCQMDSMNQVLYDSITRDNQKCESKEMRGKGTVKKPRKQKRKVWKKKMKG